MGQSTLPVVLAGWLLLGGASFAQSQAQDPASPRSGNGERGRELLAVLGPRPASGFSPLQQQELTRRVRCAATRQQIQDELDIEAAGATGSLYVMSELRMLEKENCASVPLPPGMQAAPAAVPAAPVATASTWQPPKTPVSTAAPVPPRPAPHEDHAASSPARSAVPAMAATAVPKPVPQPMGAAYTPSPDYPPEEMAAGHEGVVVVQLVMNTDGSVRTSTVAKSCGYPALDEAAVKVTRTWRIPAAAGDGRTIGVPLSFSAH